MSMILDHLLALGDFRAAMPQDEAKLKQSAETGTDSDRLGSASAVHGYALSAEEAKQIDVKAGAMLAASSGRAPISVEILDAINSGITLAGIDAAIGRFGTTGHHLIQSK